MTQEHINQILNRVLAVHSRSLPSYLHYAQPHQMKGDQQAKETLAQIVQDQAAIVERVGHLILDNNGITQNGRYPISWTAYNDLAYDFLVGRMIENQTRDITEIEACVAELPAGSQALALAEESLGQAKAHLELLQELVPSDSTT